jgi:spore coat polysaccharide biosynthesis protein SpsF
MGSSRLPGKVLLDIAGQPMLVHVIERARRAQTIDQVIVATTTDPGDDPVAEMCAERGYLCFRGNLHDVLDRYHGAAKYFGTETVVRLTADCPLVDPLVIDQVVLAFRSQFSAVGSLPSPYQQQGQAGLNYGTADDKLAFDFACSRLPPPWKRTFPIGQDVEVCSFNALQRAWEEADRPYHREHVMPYLYEESRSIHYTITVGQSANLDPLPLAPIPPSSENMFRVLILDHDPDFGNLRWTVDTFEDLVFVRQVFERFPPGHFFGWYEVLALLEHEPGLSQINVNTHHKEYREFDQRSQV